LKNKDPIKLTILKEDTKVKMMKGLSKRISRLFTPLEILSHYSLRARGPPSGAEAPLSELEDSPSRKLGRSLGQRLKQGNILE
jgi:hypothetical protein